MNFIEELKWRGMYNDATPGVEEHLKEKMRVGYIGFDPTAPALTIGNYVQIMILKLFQMAGHKPIVIMGGATGRIGDPSGKDKERELKSFDELDSNLENQMIYFRKFLDFESGDNKAEFRNNLDIYSNMNVLDFLRDVGKSLTVNYMMSKTSVKKRVETGLSFTEFSYQLIQGYDFQYLYENDDVTIQMGGSDQWGNITTGTEFIGKNIEGGKAYAVTTPLLTKTDGSKFGKSEAGNIWLDPKMTSPYKFYQFWINAADDDIAKFTRYFSLKSRAEIEALEANHAENPNAMKKALAEELVIRVHGKSAFESVEKVSGLLFNKKASNEYLMGLSSDDLATVVEEIPSFEVANANLSDEVNVIELITEHAAIMSSKGEAKRAIKGNAISINKVKVGGEDFIIKRSDWLHDKYLMVENGKKNKYILSLLNRSLTKFEEWIVRYKEEFEKIGVPQIDENLLRKVAKGCGPSIYNSDASRVAVSDKNEIEAVKRSFLIKKMGLEDSEKLDKALKRVGDKFGEKNRNKFRAMFYYLLTKDLKLEEKYQS